MRHLRLALVPIFLAYFTILLAFILLQNRLVLAPPASLGPYPQGGTSWITRTFISQPPDGVHLERLVGPPSKRNPSSHSLLPRQRRRPRLFGRGLPALFVVSDLMSFYSIITITANGKSPNGPSEGLLDSDARSAYDWLKAKGFKDSGTLGPFPGPTRGGPIGFPGPSAGLILEGAFPSIYAVSRVRFPWLFVLPSMVENKFETEKYIQDKNCPLLEIHAEKDAIIPIRLRKGCSRKRLGPKSG